MSDSGRQRQIVELLRDRPFASVRELQERLGVSAATVRRDIDRIDEAGEARKVYGGISALDGASQGGVAYARPYDENRDLAVEAKRQIASVAATMVSDGDAVIVHGGSTCFHLGVKLADRNIRLYTNSMPLAAYLSDHGHCSLTVAGGDLHREPGIIHSLAQASPFYASKFFLGAQGLNQEGVLESHPLLVRSIIDLSLCADQIVVLADSRKLSIHARNVALPWSRIGTLVTDDGLSDADARMLEDAGVMVRIASASGSRPVKVAVLDFGKTNSKLFVFGQDGRILDERRTQPKWIDQAGFSVLDEAVLHDWALGAVTEAAESHGVEGVMVSGHGCTFALVDDQALTHPILDYEQEPPAEIAARIDRRIPDFAETFSPRLPLGFNYGRHMLWLQEVEPDAFARANSILGYPQYWSWRLGGRAVSEVSYLGCHSHLWAPRRRDFSSLVDAQGWRGRMPAFERAGTVIGERRLGDASRPIAIHNGVHDSNAALHTYRRQALGPLTVVSTGTWVVVLNPDCPLDALDRERDMLVNVDVDGGPVPTIRFMGGREFAVISGGWQGEIPQGSVQQALDAGIMALPSFAPGGPMPDRPGHLVGREPDAGERAAAALLYVAMMIDLCLDLIHSKNTVIVDGGLNTGGLLAGLLAQLRPGQAFLQGASLEGSATGAAALAFESAGRDFAAEPPGPAHAARFNGLAAYRDVWRDRVAGHDSATKAAGGAR